MNVCNLYFSFKQSLLVKNIILHFCKYFITFPSFQEIKSQFNLLIILFQIFFNVQVYSIVSLLL